jgi:hypothetical protein
MSPASKRTGFSVEIAADAWTQLGPVSVENYQRIRTELDMIAAALMAPPSSITDSDQDDYTSPVTRVIAGYRIRYAVSESDCRVTLLDVRRAADES